MSSIVVIITAAVGTTTTTTTAMSRGVQWKEDLEEIFEIHDYDPDLVLPELEDDTSSSLEDDDGSLEDIPLEPQQQTTTHLDEDLPPDFGEGQRLEGFYE